MKTAMAKPRPVTAIAPWYGSNRTLAHAVGEELTGCKWVGVVFAGGMCELAHIGARQMLVNDKHRHMINMARAIGHPVIGPKLYRRLRRLAFHPAELAEAQARCRAREESHATAGLFGHTPTATSASEVDINWAVDYFTVAWMGRHGNAGTDAEFKGGLSFRWNANGGSSSSHFFGAVRELPTWRRVLRRCEFQMLDFREFLEGCKDEAGHGIYCDPPFPGPGDKYVHKFTIADHRDLARRLIAYRSTRVVCRFYDHPLIRELYPETLWRWRLLEGGKKQTNEAGPEVLLINRLERAA